MAVQKPALTTALSNWQQRAQQYAALGIPQSSWYQIAVNDIQNVANTGASPMAGTDVNAAMAAQMAGHTIVGNPVHHSHGILGDIAHAVTSVPSDVGGLITGFLPGAAHFAAHLPSEVAGTAGYITHGGGEALLTGGLAPTSSSDRQWLQAHGYEDPTGSFLHRFAADIANTAHTPVGSLIPGVADAANLETSAGRQYLLSHPVTAALDVAPAGKIAGLGARGAVAAGVLKAGEEGGALESLQAGRPIQATGRGLSAAAGKLPVADTSLVARAVSRSTWANFTNQIGYGDLASRVNRASSEIGREYSRKVAVLRRPLEAAMKKMSGEERNQIAMEATGRAPVTPEHEHVVQIAKEITDTLRHYGEIEFAVTKGKDGLITRRHGKGRLTFSASDPLKRTVVRLRKVEEQTMPKIQADIRASLAATNKAADRVKQAQAALDAVKAQAAATMRPAGRRVAQLEKQLTDAQSVLTRRGSRLATLEGRRRAVLASYVGLRRDFHEGVVEAGGDKAMRPLVKQRYRAGVAATRQQLHAEEEATLSPLNDPTHPAYDPTTYQARVKAAAAELDKDLNDIEHSSSMSQVRDALERPADRLGYQAKEYAKAQTEAIQRDAVENVLDMVHRGLDPVWLKHVDPGDERRMLSDRVSVIPDHVTDITQYNRSVFNLAPVVNDVAIGISAAGKDFFRNKATNRFLKEFVLPHAKTVADLEAQYQKLARDDIYARRRPATYDMSGHAQTLMKREWTAIDPTRFGLKDWGGAGRFSAQDQLMIPKWLHTNLKAMMPGEKGVERLPAFGAYDRVMKVFRFAVLTGPRHLVHVGVAGLVPLMMRDPFAPRYFANALQILKEVRDGDHARTYGRLVKNLYPDITDGVYSKAVGHQYGSMLSKFWQATGGNLQVKLARLEETVSDMYRVSTMLSGEARGLDREEAIVRANKVAVDMDDLAPFERTVMKHVFPFYGFTKFLFRFLLTYPVDHPYRVALLSRFAVQEQQDWNSLIPEKFMLTLFLGHPDSHGNIKTVDLRNLNPFRSFSNDMTMTGFFQSLNPIESGILAARGFNVLDGVGPLYPSLEYNPSTGSLQAAPPSGGTAAVDFLQQFIPEIGTLDHFVGLTDGMRRLKQANPAAYKAQLYSQLNLPGVLAPPISVNLPYVEEKAEMDRYKAASASVSAYEEGKAAPDAPADFQVVPYQGQYVDPQAFQKYWQSLVAGSPSGIDPRALMATPERKTSPDPLELLSGLSQIPGPPTPNY